MNSISPTAKGVDITPTIKRNATRHGMDVDEYIERIQTHKWCSSCNEWLPHSAFTRHASRGDGLQSFCQGCQQLAVHLNDLTRVR